MSKCTNCLDPVILPDYLANELLCDTCATTAQVYPLASTPDHRQPDARDPLPDHESRLQASAPPPPPIEISMDRLIMGLMAADSTHTPDTARETIELAVEEGRVGITEDGRLMLIKGNPSD